MHALADKHSFNAQDVNAKEIARRLDPALFRITLFYVNKPDEQLLHHENIRLVKISDNRYISSIQILRHLLKKNFDIFFYVRNFYIDYLYFKLRRFIGDRKITIYQIENVLPPPTNEEYRKRAKAIATKSDYIFSVSKYVAETAKTEYGITTPVMYVGIDTELFTTVDKNIEKKEEAEIEVLYVGSLQERKRPHLVVEAAKYFPHAHFTIVGQGPLKEKLILLIQKNNLTNITLMENVSFKNLISCYQEADIFLFPSSHEGFPKVTLEAASCGLPAIVFHHYKPETVLDGKTGFVVKDFQEMLEKLDILIHNEILRRKLANNAIEYSKEFDWENIASKWENIFNSVANYIETKR